MAKTTAAPTQAPKLAYKLRSVAGMTEIGYDRLRAYIDSGELKAKRDRGANGEPVGPYRILHEDLQEFLRSMHDA